MVTVKIDGTKTSVPEQTSILEAARDTGIQIPTLCYHRALGPQGACRMCIVEAEGPRLEKTVLAACSTSAVDGLVVETSSDLIRRLRQDIMGLILSGTEATDRLKAMARRAGVPNGRSTRLKEDPCILCGLCVRACSEIIKARALSFRAAPSHKHRVAEEVAFDPERCIGCGTCAVLCPVAAVKVEDKGRRRDVILYGKRVRRFALVSCALCGKPFTTEEHINFVSSRITGDPGGTIGNACPECSRSRFAVALTGMFPVGTER